MSRASARANSPGAPPPAGSPTRLYARAVTGALAGAIAGAGVGVCDGLWSLHATAQFLGSFTGKLALLGYLAAGYALVGALAGVLASLTLALYARTRLGDAWRFARAQHERTRERDPRAALAGLSLALAVLPCVAAALGLAYVLGAAELAQRKHLGLIVAAAMGLALVAALAGLLAGVLLARLVELGLVALARTPGPARVLSSPRAPVVALIALLAIAIAGAAYAAWDTLALLHLRPAWVVLAGLFFALGTAPLGASLAARLAGTSRLAWRAGPAAALVLFGVVFIGLGSIDNVRKAANAYSGLGAAIPRPLRALTDFDRDGYSSILGGGDCDDWDANVHPGAEEIPDDGVDQNCVGGDPSLERAASEVAFAEVPASVPRDFNVLLITIDTLRADHLSAYGYERKTSPHIDRVAREGALFANAWAHAPSTRYSIPAILTGRYPLSVDYDTSIAGWPGLAQSNTTIAEILAGAGMSTGAILNYWYFDRQRHMDQGFEHYDNRNQRLHKQVPGKGPAETQGSSSKEQTDEALAFIAERADRRFFLWVHYYDPHYQYEPHPSAPPFGDRPVDRYDQEIHFTDQHIGRLFADLRRRGLYERTVIVITGDHGEGFGEHGIDLHGYHLYAAQTKVPLIIRVPGLPARVITTPAGHIDILPTLANLAGARPDAMMMGRSLVDLMAGAAGDLADELADDLDRVVFQQLSYENNNEMRAAASRDCHVIYNVSPDTSWELYRIDEDPDESRDMIHRPGACDRVRRALERWYDRSELPVGAAEALLDARPDIARPTVVDFGDAVRLLAVTLPDQPVRPGQGFEVVYTFEARGALPGGWKVFAHFEGPSRQRFQGDHAPPRPFAWWRAGQFIRYTHTVTVPANAPNGRYDLWMGLFRGHRRQPARASSIEVREDRALVGAVEVAR